MDFLSIEEVIKLKQSQGGYQPEPTYKMLVIALPCLYNNMKLDYCLLLLIYFYWVNH